MSEPTFTRDQVSAAVNAGAEMVLDVVDNDERDTDLVNLVVNATLTLLIEPSADLDDVIAENYEATPDKVRGWVQ